MENPTLEPLARAVFRWMRGWKQEPLSVPQPSLETESMTPYDFSIEPEKRQFRAELALFKKEKGDVVSLQSGVYGFTVGVALGLRAPLAYGIIDVIDGFIEKPSAKEAVNRLEKILELWHVHGDIWTL